MYVNDFDFEAMTIKKLIDLVFAEMVYRKKQHCQKKIKLTGIDGQCLESALRCLMRKNGGIRYTERALELLNHRVM